MDKVTKEIIDKVADKFLLDVKEEEYPYIFDDLNFVIEELEKISLIEGFNNCQPMIYPYEVNGNFLREDQVEETIDQKSILDNAPEIKNGYIRIPKVIK